jgi:hypothetical protein
VTERHLTAQVWDFIIKEMEICPKCGRQCKTKQGLAGHLQMAHGTTKASEREAKMREFFRQQEIQVKAQVHAEVERQKIHFELLQLADDIERTYYPLMTCFLCARPWSEHRYDFWGNLVCPD